MTEPVERAGVVIPRADITGLVLAGGRGSRMGGADKGLQLLRGEHLAARAMRRLAPQVGSVVINANRSLPIYRTFADAVCSDDTIPGFAGPLAGIVAGLEACCTPYLATVPCDSPDFPLDLVQRLGDALARHNADVAVAVAVLDGQWRRQPVFCLLRADLLPRLRQAVADGIGKVGGWMAAQRLVEVRFDDPGAFVNINTREELDALQAAGGAALP